MDAIQEFIVNLKVKKADRIESAMDRLVCQDVDLDRIVIHNEYNGGFNLLVDGEIVFKAYVRGELDKEIYRCSFEELWFAPYEHLNV